MLLPSEIEPESFLPLTEFGLTAILVAAAFILPRLGAGFFERIERSFERLSRRRGMPIYAGVTVIVLRLALLPWFPIPLPFVPDDFSFLLAGDTFTHGLLTNPTPAMWTHFESVHIDMQPTYQSMYFPGQGLVLAAGKILFGQPWFALLAVDGLLCAALVWMLQAWLPRRWALLGGILAVLRLGLFSVWINTYHTAALLSALGGTLVLGSLPRLMKTGRFRYGLLMGVGIAILVLTRPYEGLLMCLPVGVALGYWAAKKGRQGKNRPPLGILARRAIAPLLVIFATVSWLGYYDYRAFGNALTLPYTINRQTYAMAPYYIWQKPRPEPAYRHPAMRALYAFESGLYGKVHSLESFLPWTVAKVAFVVPFFTGFALIPPLFMARRVFLDRRIRFLVVCVVVLAGGMAIEVYLLPYYMAPFTAALYAVGLQLMRHLRVWRLGKNPVGLALVRFMIASCFVMAVVRVAAGPLHLGPQEWPTGGWDLTWYGPQHFGTERAGIEARLSQLPGDQLAIVRYGDNHHIYDEWVYNGPNIDGSKVVWAREMDAADNLELIHYYGNRQVWLIEPDAIPARISPYPTPEAK
jgi:hypothetical protein